MNKYTYTTLMVLLQTIGLVTVVRGADLRYGQQNLVKIFQNENIDLEGFFSLNENDVIINNLNNLVKNNNSSLSSVNLTKCSIIPRVDNQEQQENTSIRFLPQAKNSDILKGVYDYEQTDVCKPDQNNRIISRVIDSPQSERKNNQEDNFEFKQISLLDYEQNKTEFKPIEPSDTYLQTTQELNIRTNSNPISLNYRINYQSLSLINSIAIKPISIATNSSINNLKNNRVVSNQSIPAQPVNPQNNLEYSNLNGLSDQPIGANSININTNSLPNYQIQVASSPILDKIKKETDKQQQQMERKLQQQQRRIEQQEQRRRQQQQRKEEQERKKREQERKKREQQLIQR
jgi:hypothetical protein